jgi:hypothetical protein
MTVVARRVASTPRRTASDTWTRIVEIIAPDANSAARAELDKAAGVACSAISAEALRDDAFIVTGTGPRVRVYCIFGDDAITGDDVSEDGLQTVPTDGDWTMSIPCPPEDLEWSKAKLASACSRITARAMGEEVASEASTSRTGAAATINVEEFMRS